MTNKVSTAAQNTTYFEIIPFWCRATNVYWMLNTCCL